ncbi:sensor histidine kinase [Lysobacter sp. A286]
MAILARLEFGAGLTRELPLGFASALFGASLAVLAIQRGWLPTSSGRHSIEARLRQQREELRALARRIITLQEDERSTLSRELHDDIGQDITAIKLSVMALEDEDSSQRAATIAEIGNIADSTVIKLRNISLLLRPPQLDALGLESALRWQASALIRPGGPRLELALEPLPRRPDPAVEVACFRVAQEALTNALRHSGASAVSLTLVCDGHSLLLTIHDNGCGFDRARTRGLGMITMRERAQQLDGTLQIDTQAGLGTRLSARFPMHRSTAI